MPAKKKVAVVVARPFSRRRVLRISRMPYKAKHPVYRFARTVEYTYSYNPALCPTFHANTNTTSAAAGYLTLTSLPSVTDFSNLFDQYKITGFKMTWLYSHNSDNSTAVAQTTSLPLLYTVYDSDDGTPMASINTMNEYMTCRVRRLDRPQKIFVRPKVATPAYAGGAFTGWTQPGTQPWIDMATTNVQYYGCKWAIDANGATANAIVGQIKLIVKVYIKCRDVN